MPGRWVGGKRSKACPSKGDFVEGQVLDDGGKPQGSVFLEVKRIYAPGAGGRFILGDVLSASDRFYRHWLTTEDGRVTASDGSYHLCSQGASECDVKGSGGVVVHLGKWRNWPAEELSNGLPIEFDKECRSQVNRYMKEGPARGAGGGGRKPALIPYGKSKPAAKAGITLKEKKPRPSSSSQKKPEEDSYSTSFGSEEELPPKVSELREELVKLKASLKKAEEEAHKGKKRKKGDAGSKPEKKKRGRKEEPKKKKKKEKASFETGIEAAGDDDPPDYSAGDGSEDPGDEDPSDDSETKKESSTPKSKKKKKSKKKRRVERAAKEKKKKDDGSSISSEGERKRKKKKKKKRKDKGPFGVGTTEGKSSGSEPEDTEDSSEDFQKAPSGMSHQLKLVKYAQKFPGKLAARLLKKMSLATRFSGGAAQVARKQMGKVSPAAHVYFLTVMTPQLRERWTPRTQRELKCWVTVLDLLAENLGPQAADVAGQRIKALEKSVVDGQWRRAKFLELVEQEDLPLTDRGEENMMRKEQELEEKLKGKGNWTQWNDWSTKGGKDHDDRGKGKGKKGKGWKGKNPTDTGTGQAEKKGKDEK